MPCIQEKSNFKVFSCPRLACAVPHSVMVLGNGGKAAHMVKGTHPTLHSALCGWAMVLGKLDDYIIFISLRYFQLTLGSVKTQPQRALCSKSNQVQRQILSKRWLSRANE